MVCLRVGSSGVLFVSVFLFLGVFGFVFFLFVFCFVWGVGVELVIKRLLLLLFLVVVVKKGAGCTDQTAGREEGCARAARVHVGRRPPLINL